MDAILILGAAVWPNGPSPTLQRRTMHAAQLFHKGAAPLIIPCGGLGTHPPTEAAIMQQLLMAEGVPKTAIVLEDRSTSTLDNIRFAKLLLAGPRVTIVTDRYHAPRALMVARHLGLQAHADCPAMPGLPTKHYIREALARPAYAWRLRRLPRG